jgi:alpha-L-fucosidase
MNRAYEFPKSIRFNRALTMEWLNDGQHIQRYSIDIWTGTA